MRRPKGLGPLLLFVIGSGAVASAGCSEKFSDEAFGVLDLATVYDGGSLADPAGAVPLDIEPVFGFVDGEYAEYYAFGSVPVQRDPLTGVPRSADVQPMYFFFNEDRQPLFSAPARETRDFVDWMRGGKGVLKPNPKEPCDGVPEAQRATHACNEASKNERKKPYPVRFRDLLIDELRGSADYQRPIVDVSPADISGGSTRPRYTGLWEIVEITVPSGYEPDAIKHAATLERALASEKFQRRATGKVINCPIIDERSYIQTGVTVRDIFHPRIELWYRRKMTICYLANGWETLGNDKGQPHFAGNDEQRLDTFDVVRKIPSEGTTRLTVPVGIAYEPAVYVSDPIDPFNPGNDLNPTRLDGGLVSQHRPRHTAADPPGYRPIRWMWDFRVPPNHNVGTIKSVAAIDRSPLGTVRRSAVVNLPLRGAYIRCGLPETIKRSPLAPAEVTVRDPPLTGPIVGQETCPGINSTPPATLYNCQCGELREKIPGIASTEFVDGSKDPVCNALGLVCNPYNCYCDLPFKEYGEACGPVTGQCKFIEYVLEKPSAFAPRGLTCFPPWGGRCHLLCSTRETNTFADENKGKKPTEVKDSRCKSVPGFQCISGLCLKFCDIENKDPKQCVTVTQKDDKEQDIGEGQTCQDWGVEICTWPENYGL